MNQYFAYVRVSTPKQGEGVSLEAQREAIERYAAAHSLTITQWFEEKETAAKAGRPVFLSMIKALRNGEATGLIMHKIDRSARNGADWLAIGELSDAGTDVRFATESLDFRSRSGRLSADIQAVIAADYIRNLREETVKGINGRLKQGLYPFKAPIGYCDNGGGKPKTPDPLRAPLIQQVFELYASGEYSLRSLVMEMDERGLRNQGGKPLSKHGIETILANPFYTGLIRIKTTGETYQGVHEPLIPVSLFDTVADVRAGKCGKKVTKHRHTYRGLFRCTLCGYAMIPERQKSYVYYRCQTTQCPTTCVREDVLEAAVADLLERVALSPEDITRITEEIEAWNSKQTAHDPRDGIRLQLEHTKRRLDRLTDALIDQLIDKDTFTNRKQSLELERLRLEKSLAKQTEAHVEPDRIRYFLERIKSLKTMFISAIATERREIVRWATSNCLVERKNVYLEPANWLVAVEAVRSGTDGDPHSPNPRSRQEMIEALIVAERAVSATEGLLSLP
ncbi:recombinase family protein [Salaquimonas pukyongi]|uniref:recombinase family protein n=1 Tax=Salaquimonas pukyongi TaxID=2712698 RepID=UPI00096BA695|nr:recombinase family protein [Salaquimonas pukyongi]